MGHTCRLKIRGKVLKPGPEAAGPRVKPLPGADLNHSAVSSGTMTEKLSWNSEVMDRVWRTMGGGSCDGLSLRETSTPAAAVRVMLRSRHVDVIVNTMLLVPGATEPCRSIRSAFPPC